MVCTVIPIYQAFIVRGQGFRLLLTAEFNVLPRYSGHSESNLKQSCFELYRRVTYYHVLLHQSCYILLPVYEPVVAGQRRVDRYSTSRLSHEKDAEETK